MIDFARLAAHKANGFINPRFDVINGLFPAARQPTVRLATSRLRVPAGIPSIGVRFLKQRLQKDDKGLRHPNDNGFADRRKAADEAKKLLLKKFVTAPKADDPELAAKLAERQALSEAREIRRAERAKAKQEELERQLAEAAALTAAADAEAKAEAEARESEAKNRIARVVSDEAERKAERDRRYAARKARR